MALKVCARVAVFTFSMACCIAGCSGGSGAAANADSASSTSPSSNPTASNPVTATVSPSIAGEPLAAVAVGSAYSFSPQSSPSGATVRFSVTNQPSWTKFDVTTGTLSGTPAESNIGSTGPITIAVSDGVKSAALAPFSITVNPATSKLLTATNNGAACMAATLPSADTLFASKKRVFAHYFASFPLSIDNKSSASDYYNTQYLNKEGESSKWSDQGGYLRQRPLGVPVQSAANWQQLNMQKEVSMAIARGITGFTFDVMSASEATSPTGPLQLMLKAAQAVDSRFKIMVMPDLTALGNNSAAVVQIIQSVAKSPAAYRSSDGRLVVTAFDANLQSPSWWKAIFTTLTDSDGIPVFFVPTFLGWTQSAAAFGPVTQGFGDWGTATPTSSVQMQGDPALSHNTYNKLFMMPINSQQFRPKNFEYWEAGNSATFRDAWTSAIKGGADWVQMVTWSDFSESGEVEPATDTTLNRSIGTGFYDLTAYYAAWFLTGTQPAITHDVLYYFYRREPTGAAASRQSEGDKMAIAGAIDDNIELVAFLTAPGVISITIGGHTYSENAPAGVTSFTIASEAGTPVFSLSRNETPVFSFQGGIQIYGHSGLPNGTLDLTYWSGSASQSGICSL
jgi:hypothetical protein